MEQTTKGKNKAMKVMLVILAILGLSAGAVAYYLSSIEEFTPTNTSAFTLNTSDMCKQILYFTAETSTTPEGAETIVAVPEIFPFVLPGEDQQKDLDITTGQSVYALVANVPSDAPTGYDIEGYSLTINGVTTSPQTTTIAELDEQTRLDLLSTLKGKELDIISNQDDYTLAIVELDGYTEQIDLNQATLNVVATTTITTPEGNRKASCAGIFAVTTVLEEGAEISETEEDTTAEEETASEEDDGSTEDASSETQESSESQQAGGTSTTSDITVTKTADVTCVERIAPTNAITFTITIRNNDTDSEEIVTVKDKLPLGFTYTPASTLINGAAQSDSIVTVIVTGDTQEITWDPTTNFALSASESLIIQFDAIAGDAALSGSRTNEVVVTPLNTPVDAAALRTELVFTVASNCSNPDTGLLDSLASRVAVGLITIMMAVLFYKSENSITVSENLAGSVAYKKSTRNAKLFGLKLTSPREYFEEKFKDED